MLPITREQFLEGVVGFLKEYKRLPYLPDDDIVVQIKNKENEPEYRPYRANRYIEEYYETQDKLTDKLFDSGVLSAGVLSEMSGFSETIINNLITKSTANPDIRARRAVHMILNSDYYESELGSLNTTHCSKCTKRRQCGQHYWVDIVSCSKYKKSEAKNTK